MPKKTFLGVLLAMFISGLLVASLKFDATKAASHSGSDPLVGGYISENTTWTLENSPYVFIDDVIVSSNATLTIEPGVVVDLDLWSLRVEGTLCARGNEGNRIKFQSSEIPLHQPRIHFWPTSTPWNETSESGCIIEYAEIKLHTTMYGNLDEPIIFGRYASPKISNNLVINYGNGVNILTGGTVSNNTIMNGYCGIVAESSCAHATISYNVVRNTEYGIIVGGQVSNNDPVIIGNLIINNSQGIRYIARSAGSKFPYISNNTVVKNRYGFDFYYLIKEEAKHTIIFNNIHSNEYYDVIVEEEDPRIYINMTRNWWGTTNTSLIDQKIWDQKDDRRLCLANYTTFLTSSAISLDSNPPMTFHDYDGAWHNKDYFINLNTSDDLSGIAEIYYKINGGIIKAVSIEGQPLITTEDANNTLEYWSVDNAGNEEIPHKVLTEIKLDKTAPTIETPLSMPNGDVQPDQEVRVSVNVTDALSNTKSVVLSYTSNRTALWLDFPMTFNSTTSLWEYTISGQQANTLVKYKIEAYDNAGNYKVDDHSGQYYSYTVIPEFPSFLILPLFMIATLLAVIVCSRKHTNWNKKTGFMMHAH